MMADWQPIETAPKHWEPVLVWGISEAEREDAADEERDVEYCAMVAHHSDIQPGHWWLVSTMQRVFNPSHWMPLPEAPDA
jgi:hypothetical protein